MPSSAVGTARQRSLPEAVRTLVVSDLHLGARTGVDVLQRPAARGALLERLDGVDRLVLLGDTLELRHGPVREALAAARPVLEAIGAAMAGDEGVGVAGNHDPRLLAPGLRGRGDGGRPPPPRPPGPRAGAGGGGGGGPPAAAGAGGAPRPRRDARDGRGRNHARARARRRRLPRRVARRGRLRAPRPLRRPPLDGPEL